MEIVDYWHPKNEEGCKTRRESLQYKRDRQKGLVAVENGYTLHRIRESNPDEIINIISRPKT